MGHLVQNCPKRKEGKDKNLVARNNGKEKLQMEVAQVMESESIRKGNEWIKVKGGLKAKEVVLNESMTSQETNLFLENIYDRLKDTMERNEHDGGSQNVEGMNGEQMQEIKSQGKTLENDVNKQNLGDNVSLTMTLLMFKAPEIASFNGTKEVNRKKRSFKV